MPKGIVSGCTREARMQNRWEEHEKDEMSSSSYA